MSGSAKQGRAAAGMRIFRAAQATDLTDADMPTVNVTPADQEGIAAAVAAGGLEGAVSKVLFAEPISGMSLVYLWFKPGFVLPRHSHNVDCLYYVVSGEARLGTEVLQAGDGVFIPADHDYQYSAGPDGVEVLEFRAGPEFHLRLSGNGEAGWRRIAQAAAANLDRWRAAPLPHVAARATAGGERS